MDAVCRNKCRCGYRNGSRRKEGDNYVGTDIWGRRSLRYFKVAGSRTVPSALQYGYQIEGITKGEIMQVALGPG